MSELRQKLLHAFKTADVEKLEKYSIDPIFIEDLAVSNNLSVIWKDFPNWTDFEYGYSNLTDVDIYNVIFKDKSFYKGIVFIVNGQAIKEDMAFAVKPNALMDFIDSIYPNTYNINFFEPHDYVFISFEQKMIVALFHEGRFTHITW